MGREVRRVPPNWEHPVRDCKHSPWQGGCDQARANGGKCYQPMRDSTAEAAWADWQAEYEKWVADEAERRRVAEKYGEADYPPNEPYRAFCRWHGPPPDPAYYRPDWDEATATWFQVYETVGEGTPVTPPFATQEELVDYLATHGDFWDQQRRRDGVRNMECGPWDRGVAERFVRIGWAPSSVVLVKGPGEAEILRGADGLSG